MPKRKLKKLTTLGQLSLEAQATAEAKRIARDSGVSEGLWELFLTDAYRRITGLSPDAANDASKK